MKCGKSSAQKVCDSRWGMAGTDKESSTKSYAEAWDKAEKLLKKGNPESALEALRVIDGKGEHPTTLRLAGNAIWDMAKESG